LGAIDAREQGPARALLAINARLYEKLAGVPNVHVLDAQRWMAAAERGYSTKAWYLGKVAFNDEVFAEAALEIKAALRALTGQIRKLLVLDLDDTLWGGIVGDVGWENLSLGGHDGEGEAFVDLQRAAKALKQRGIALAIVSKNEEAVALEAIRKHPEMVLREEDFVGWRINWTDKARNIADLATELNLGLQSVVFIDDNPVERARVREALPEVLVPEWPADKLLCPSTLLGLRCFDAASFTREDAERTQLYAAEKKRDALLTQVGSMEAWLEGLQIKVRAEPLSASNIVRAAQLLNKTNQLNLSTRRLSEAELLEWSRGLDRKFWTLTVSDRFGDAGLTGIVSMEAEGDVGRIVDFVLSCRVMGRRVEETMLHLVCAHAKSLGLGAVEAHYQQTAKNKPTLAFFERSEFKREGEKFIWTLDQPYQAPALVRLEVTE
jgi:FkbH-like protein